MIRWHCQDLPSYQSKLYVMRPDKTDEYIVNRSNLEDWVEAHDKHYWHSQQQVIFVKDQHIIEDEIQHSFTIAFAEECDQR